MSESARNRCISSAVLNVKSLAQSHRVNQIIRLLNPLLLMLGLQLSFSRYQSAVYLYSVKGDSLLYKDFTTSEHFVNFGSGGFFHRRWENFDFPGQTDYYRALQGRAGKDFVPIDLTDDAPIPLPDEYASLIYCSHTLEHLPEPCVARFISECRRVLKRPGCLRVVVPDTGFEVKCAQSISRATAKRAFSVACRAAADHLFSPSADLPENIIETAMLESQFDAERFFGLLLYKDPLNGQFRPTHAEYHLSFHSHDKFRRLCAECGFDSYLPQQAGVSSIPVFTNSCVFDTTEPQASLYGEFFKV